MKNWWHKWLLLIIYGTAMALVLWKHEMWRDELQAWGISATSDSFGDLLRNTRYEGHPLLWFLMIWPVTKVFHDVEALQVLQFILTIVLGCTVIFKGPFSVAQKAGLLFSYFFLFEYTAISRNYLIGAILIYWICIYWKESQKNTIRISLLLFLLFQTNSFAFLIGLGFSAALMLEFYGQGFRRQYYFTYIGSVTILLSGIYLVSFATPPADGNYASGWLLRWDFTEIIRTLSAFTHGILPTVKLHSYNFWNANYLVDSVFASMLAVFLLFLFIYFIRSNRSAVVIFTVSVLLILFFVYSKQIGSMRHKGHFFLALTAALWIFYAQKTDINRGNQYALRYLFGAILGVQVFAGITAWFKDVRYPFSLAKHTAAYIDDNFPADTPVAGVYQELLVPLRWYLQRPVFFLDIERAQPFVVWSQGSWNKEFFMQSDSVTFSRFAEYQKKNEHAILVMTYHVPNSQVKQGYIDTLNLKAGRYGIECFKAFENAIEREESYFLFKLKALKQEN
jgi:hypothetical protein